MVDLMAHPDAPGMGIGAVTARLFPDQERPMHYWVEFCVLHKGSLLLPPVLEPSRADGLWNTTCGEVFVRPIGARDYVEFNLSPSRRWAAYGFDGYRAGMRDIDLAVDPDVEIAHPAPDRFQLTAQLDLSSLRSVEAQVNVTMVIEEKGGTKSYWALAHPPGAPDFHNPDCFIGTLPSPSAA